MKGSLSKKIFATLALFILSTCGQKDKASKSEPTQCPGGATLVGDGCASGVQPGAQTNSGDVGGTSDKVQNAGPIDPVLPDLPLPKTPPPKPIPKPEPTDGTADENSGTGDGGSAEGNGDGGSGDGGSGDEGTGTDDSNDQDDGDSQLDPLHYTVTPPVYTTTTYADSELEARTLRLDHDADSISCSNDNGATFGECAGVDRHIFSVGDYRNNVTQVIRFTRTDGFRSESEDYSYIPQQDGQSRVAFVECDYGIDSKDSLDVITKLFSTASDLNKDGVRSICFEQGMTVSTNTNFTVAVDRLWLLGHSTDRPLILNANLASTVAACGDNRNRLFLSAGKSFALVNLNLQTSGCRGSVLEIIGTQSMDFLIQNSFLSSYGDEGDAVSILSTKGNTTGQITQSKLLAHGGAQRNFYPNGLAVNQVGGSISIDISDAEIESKFENPVHMVGGSLRMINSLVRSSALGSVAIYAESSTNRNANLFIQDSILKAEGFAIVQKTGNTIGQKNIIEVNKTRFNAAGPATKAVSFQGEPASREFNSSLNENTACSDTGHMAGWISGKQSPGSFVTEKQSAVDVDCDNGMAH